MNFFHLCLWIFLLFGFAGIQESWAISKNYEKLLSEVRTTLENDKQSCSSQLADCIEYKIANTDQTFYLINDDSPSKKEISRVLKKLSVNGFDAKFRDPSHRRISRIIQAIVLIEVAEKKGQKKFFNEQSIIRSIRQIDRLKEKMSPHRNCRMIRKNKNKKRDYSIYVAGNDYYIISPQLFSEGGQKKIHLALSLKNSNLIVKASIKHSQRFKTTHEVDFLDIYKDKSDSHIAHLIHGNKLYRGKKGKIKELYFMDYYDRDGSAYLEKQVADINAAEKSDDIIRNWKDFLIYFRDSAKGLKELHEKQIIYLDYKRENIFVSLNEQGSLVKAVAGDLGTSEKIKQEQYDGLRFRSHQGSPLYLDPYLMINSSSIAEIESPNINLTKIDSWAFGVDLIQALHWKNKPQRENNFRNSFLFEFGKNILQKEDYEIINDVGPIITSMNDINLKKYLELIVKNGHIDGAFDPKVSSIIEKDLIALTRFIQERLLIVDVKQRASSEEIESFFTTLINQPI